MARPLSVNRRRWLLEALLLGFEADFHQFFDCIGPRGDSRLHPAPIFDGVEKLPEAQMNGGNRIISHAGVPR
jgi:hypothetical protein